MLVSANLLDCFSQRLECMNGVAIHEVGEAEGVQIVNSAIFRNRRFEPSCDEVKAIEVLMSQRIARLLPASGQVPEGVIGNSCKT